MTTQTIFDEAQQAAIKAEQAFLATHGDMAYCGKILQRG